MIRDLSGKDEGTGAAPRKRRRTGGAKRKRSADSTSASGE